MQDQTEATDSITELIQEITVSAVHRTNLDEIIVWVGGWIGKVLGKLEPGAHGSIWLAQFAPLATGEATPALVGKTLFPDSVLWTEDRRREFGRGLIGWVARRRQQVNAIVRDPSERLSDGRSVFDQYECWTEPDATQAELAVPMVYQGRLLGVLNLERPAPRRFPSEVVLVTQVLAHYAAQAIHQQQVDQLLGMILGESQIDRLAEVVVRFVGNLIEASFACVFLWDMPKQCLRLRAATSPILDDNGREVGLGRACFPVPGIGITRWVFDHKMWLNVQDLTTFDPAEDAEQEAVLRRQVLQQRLGPGQIEAACVEVTVGSPGTPEGSVMGDERRFWMVTAPGRPLWSVPLPIWSRDYYFRDNQAGPLVAVPILDPRNGGSALGVMLFARLKGGELFDDSDIALLLGLARHVAQAVSRAQLAEAQEMGRELVSQVVMMEPTFWKEEFQSRLEQRLGPIREVLGADILLVRLKTTQDELTFAASDPTESGLRERWSMPGVEIPKVAYVGIGGSGHAAKGELVFIPNEDHPYRREIISNLVPRYSEGETAFAHQVRSQIAVPLLGGGGTVVGTVTAVWAKPSSQAARREKKGWTCTPEGAQEHQLDFLLYHARWLGPALETVRDMVRRSRQLSSLSVAINQLTEVVYDRKAHPSSFRPTALVVATHHDGFAFHQSFLAEFVPDTPFVGTHTLRGAGGHAWGCLNFGEQDQAHRRQGELVDDIRGALAHSDYCMGIKNAWKDFRFEVPFLPETPCLIVRKGASGARRHGHRTVHIQDAQQGDPWSALLDAFCERVFMIGRGTVEAAEMQVGMVKVGRRTSGAPREILFVTNVCFTGEGRACIDPIARETVDVLHDLGLLLSLSYGVAGRDRLQKETRQLRQKVNELYRLIEGQDE